MREKDIESKLRNEIKKLGGIAYKFTSPGNNGVPDRIVLLPGGVIKFVELKRPGGKTSKLQDMQIARIRNLGFDVRVIDNTDRLDDFISEVKFLSEMLSSGSDIE